MMNNITDTYKTRKIPTWVFDSLLILVLLLGAYLRGTGLFWGEYQYLHPDERFLAWVGTDITPIKSTDPLADQKTWISLSDYFDTQNSPLNPNNRGHGFYVYGTFPLFATRLVVEWVYGHSGFDQMTEVGRAFSALSDLLIVTLVYLVAVRLYNRKVALLAAAFSALVVLQIQQSHFFTVDNFVNLFTFLSFYIAIRIQTDQRPWADEHTQVVNGLDGAETPGDSIENHLVETSEGKLKPFYRHPLFAASLAFGVAFGLAMASKLNAAPVALLLPAAVLIRILRFPKEQRMRYALDAIKYMVLAGAVSLVIFRITQPYAFSGPGFFGIQPNPSWVAQIREQRNQASVFVDFPPAMQWARRPIWFSAYNLTVWGLGLPLGILSWVGFFWVGWQLLKGKWQIHALIWGWTAGYFTWQSLAFNPTMRYQLPIYPTLAIFAAWAVIQLYQSGKQVVSDGSLRIQGSKTRRILALLIGGAVLLLTAAYAFGFSRIYNRPITRLEASRWILQNVPGPVNLVIDSEQGSYNQPVPFPHGLSVSQENPYLYYFQPRVDGFLEEIYLPHVSGNSETGADLNLRLRISDQASDSIALVDELLIDDFSMSLDPRGEGHRVVLDSAIPLEKGSTYLFELILESDQGEISLQGDTLANEGEWDDAIPYRVEGYDPYGGIYPPDENFNMYWEETPEKLERFLRILDESDYIAITSSRQWGSLPRIPERFPLSTIYYRSLLGCPPEQEIEWCYNVAEPGMFSGDLGFELVKTFQSNPGFGTLQVNDQFAEEAFTVYDHPKVFIFQKTADYNPEQVRAILGAVDFSSIIRKPPLQYENHPEDLTLPTERLAEQRQGGTWSELFNSESALNRYPVVGMLVWYLALFALGITVYPLIRNALPGLDDKGYPLARIIGLLLLSYIVWLAGTLRIPFSKTTISLVWGSLLILAIIVAYRQRFELSAELRRKWRYFLGIEGIVLVFFIIDLLIRFGNPDLWHPWKGGEKPMDFAYLNAILKSTSFPPYDPWYAGGYLNYYYYGFMLVGVLVKLLGIVPSIAYNLIIPTIFSLIAIGAFSIAWNLTRASRSRRERDPIGSPRTNNKFLPYITGLAGALGMAVLGNLGTLEMIVLGFQRLAAPGGIIDDTGLLTRFGWTLQGLFRSVAGESLPYGIADWYWNPSRIIPAPNEFEPITEFPFFTVLYGDPHAHLFALPIALLAISFALSLVLSKARWRNFLAGVFGITLGALIVGTLRPTNTWDFYTYLALGIVALGYAILTSADPGSEIWSKFQLLSGIPKAWRRALMFIGGILTFSGLAFILYQPYADWYALGYTAVNIWQGTRTPLHAYFLHWGLFLFVIFSWMAWETIDWMATTPVSALKKLQPHKELIWFGIILLGLITIVLGIKIPGLENLPIGKGVNVAWVALPAGVWATILLLRPGISEGKKFVLFLTGTGLLLTLMVELIALRGDIFRMNTVFKFYLQVWTLFAVSAAAALGWVLVALPRWSNRWRNFWQVAFVFLVTGAALYPLMASRAKIEDRMAPEAPRTLDGMEFMQYATYLDEWGMMDLSQDYGAIRWLQENVEGSPVIVEANLRNLYHWGSRITNFTGLPGVVGWEWHQQQQRAILPGELITERIYEIDDFYQSTSIEWVVEFLRKYDVRYIILGQQERGHYPGPGLAKFEEQEGILWKEVFRDANTVIYEVIRN